MDMIINDYYYYHVHGYTIELSHLLIAMVFSLHVLFV